MEGDAVLDTRRRPFLEPYPRRVIHTQRTTAIAKFIQQPSQTLHVALGTNGNPLKGPDNLNLKQNEELQSLIVQTLFFSGNVRKLSKSPWIQRLKAWMAPMSQETRQAWVEFFENKIVKGSPDYQASRLRTFLHNPSMVLDVVVEEIVTEEEHEQEIQIVTTTTTIIEPIDVTIPSTTVPQSDVPAKDANIVKITTVLPKPNSLPLIQPPTETVVIPPSVEPAPIITPVVPDKPPTPTPAVSAKPPKKVSFFRKIFHSIAAFFSFRWLFRIFKK